MKNTKLERYGRMQRQLHRNHPWQLTAAGIHVLHSYAESKQDDLSWWDDVGFILNGRRVIVWWQHPRHIFQDMIRDQARMEAGEDPSDDWLSEGSTTNHRAVGKSRKKIVSYTSRQPSEAQEQYYDNLQSIEDRLKAEGVDFEVAPSWKRERLDWATGVSLVAPLEVRNEADLAMVAGLARRLLLGQTTLDAEFPKYQYCKADWLRDQKILAEIKDESHCDHDWQPDGQTMTVVRWTCTKCHKTKLS